ncbi:MAG: VOC family protein [Ectothiorhodospiraceae bacterium]|nr:VOC family protein [Ectothiorhodospiraceae bacterium]
MARAITPFLMFQGTAEQAINLYVSLFADAEVVRIAHYGPGEQGVEGSVKNAEFRLGNQRFICIDSPVKHDFGFTPAFSVFVDCDSEAELNALFGKLSEGGTIFMPLDDYGFSTKFGWVGDRFGVSWQLNLP